MRWLIYIFGWIFFFIAAGAFLQFSFSPLLRLIPVLDIRIALYSIIKLIPLCLIGIRTYGWIKAGKATLPTSFNGWRYGLCAIGFWFSLSALALTIALALLTPAGGMSGVPLGLAILVSGLLCIPAIVSTEISDWRGRRNVQPEAS